MVYDVLTYFPRLKLHQKRFNLIQKQILLFNELPVQRSPVELIPSNVYWNSAELMAKHLTEFSLEDMEDLIGKPSALCVFGYEEKIPLLKNVAKKLNIPVFIFVRYVDNDVIQALRRLGDNLKFVDKYIIVEDEDFNTKRRRKTTIFHVGNLHTKSFKSIISKYNPKYFGTEIFKSTSKNHLKINDSSKILAEMTQNSDYINKHNFSKYMHLPREKNKKFWAYIEVFQRIQIDDLCELITEYKPNIDKQELMLAAVILRKLFTLGDDNAEQIMILPQNSA